MGHNGTDYSYMKGDNNPAKLLKVRKKISTGRKGKRAGKEHQFYGKKRPEHSEKMKGSGNSNYGNLKPRKEYICKTCNKKFIAKVKDLRIYCSRKCHLRGENHPSFRGIMFQKCYCIKCNKEVSYRKTPHFCHSCASSLDRNNNWQGGKSKEKYGIDFSLRLREYIRYKYNYICQICGRHQSVLLKKLHIHHKDKNKKNNNEENLVPLCNNCHMRLHRLTDIKINNKLK